MITGDEVCDGDALADQTCEGLGFAGGELACADTCLEFDTSACTTCGNGVIDEGEVCDGDELGDQTCEGLGHQGGELSCADNCEAFVEDACVD